MSLGVPLSSTFFIYAVRQFPWQHFWPNFEYDFPSDAMIQTGPSVLVDETLLIASLSIKLDQH